MRKKIDIIILCGGMGTRFREVYSDRPKSLAPIYEKPFLDILIEPYIKAGFSRFILATGHMSEYIETYYADKNIDAEIEISRESEPLGTAGAVKNAASKIRSQDFFVMNGDSYCPIDPHEFYKFHSSKPNAMASVVLSLPDNRADIGGVSMDHVSCKITSFKEKSKGTHVNAGVYIFNKNLLEKIPQSKNVSLEFDTFPSLVGKGFYGFVTDNKMTDIGTKERYRSALKHFKMD